MTLPSMISLEEAKSAFVVANTPLYFVRRLQQDSNTRLLNEHMTGEEILEEFKNAIAHKPQTLDELIVPYVCLIALSLRDDITPLQKTTEIIPAPGFKWLDYIQQVLIQTYKPMDRRQYGVPPAIELGVFIRSDSATQNTFFKVS